MPWAGTRSGLSFDVQDEQHHIEPRLKQPNAVAKASRVGLRAALDVLVEVV